MALEKISSSSYFAGRGKCEVKCKNDYRAVCGVDSSSNSTGRKLVATAIAVVKLNSSGSSCSNSSSCSSSNIAVVIAVVVRAPEED